MKSSNEIYYCSREQKILQNTHDSAPTVCVSGDGEDCVGSPCFHFEVKQAKLSKLLTKYAVTSCGTYFSQPMSWRLEVTEYKYSTII